MSSLDASLISQQLRRRTNARLDTLEIFGSIDSTNSYLMARPAPAQGRFRVAIADHQTHGRGRHDRRWLSPQGSGLYLSLGYAFEDTPGHLPGLTLALGVAVVNALASLDISGISLKWPNDIVALGGKLGGILSEMQSGNTNGAVVVTGIGLNLDLPDRMDLDDDFGWAHKAVDVKTVAGGLPSRTDLAARIIDEFVSAIVRYERDGFEAFVDDWRRHDWLKGREVTVDTPGRQVTGTADGIDAEGALLVSNGPARMRIVSGSIVLANRAEPAL